MGDELRAVATEDAETASSGDVTWHCVRSKLRSEHIAAAHLEKIDGVEVFCPRIRFEKATRRGRVWFVEALFPGYVFVRFDLVMHLRLVSATPSVTKVVKFGGEIPAIPSAVINELSKSLDDESAITVQDAMAPGDEVEVVEGPMRGMMAVVTRLMPAKERVGILLDFLGSVCQVEVSRGSVLGQKEARSLAMTEE
ncbi:MAG: transcription termination/antitermination NusG family protein [Verrucomicrobiota bacterium]